MRHNIQGSRTITRRPKDGDKGNDGSQGAFSIQKDWIIGDTHHNTSEVVDFIYVRGDSGATSYWYKKVTLGTNVASTPPQGGVTPYTIGGVTYEKVPWLDTLAVKTFIAEGGNLGGLIFKNNRLISQRGTVNGQTSSDFNNPNFVPNILIDGNTGYAEFANAKIRGEIEAIMGRIGGLIIENSRLLSKNHKVEIDGENGLIMLKDDSLTLRTIIHPNNIVSIDEYFASEGSYNVDLSSLNTANFTGEKSKGLSIPGDRNKMHQLSIPSFTIGAYATLTSSAADSDKVEVATKAWLLQDGVPFIDLGSAVAIAYGDAPKSQTVTIPSRTIPVLGGRRYVIEITNGAQNQEDPYATTYGSISGLSSMFTGSLINRSEIGNNGMVMATSQLNYDYMVDGLHQVRRGAIGLRITSSGIQKSSNMSASNPTWTNL